MVGYAPFRAAFAATEGSKLSQPVDIMTFGPDLKISHVATIKAWLALTPSDRQSTVRSAIIDLTNASGAVQSALLLFLEEPPPGTWICITVAELDLVLPTIQSRCQLHVFFPPSAAEIIKDHADWLGMSGAVQLASLLSSGFSEGDQPLPTPATFVRVNQLLQLLDSGTAAAIFAHAETFGATDLFALRVTLIQRALRDRRYLLALIKSYQSSDPLIATFLVTADILSSRL